MNDKEITKENYLEHIAESFSKSQHTLNQELDKVNQDRAITGFPELRDITPRFFNANTNAVKYFKSNGINYYDPIINNPEEIAMEAFIVYTKKLHSEAINELVYLNKDINKVKLDIVNSKEYKSRMRQRKIYSELCDKMPYIMRLLSPYTRNLKALNAISYSDLFQECKEHLKKYEELGDKIYNLDPDKDILTVFKAYLENAYYYIKAQTYSENIIENADKQNKAITSVFKSLVIVLIKLNKKKEIEELELFCLNLIKKGLQELHDNFKVQSEDFRRNVNLDGTDNIVQEPEDKGYSRRRKKGSSL